MHCNHQLKPGVSNMKNENNISLIIIEPEEPEILREEIDVELKNLKKTKQCYSDNIPAGAVLQLERYAFRYA